jgi:uncharacterized protein YdcH (DUF465 family)
MEEKSMKFTKSILTIISLVLLFSFNIIAQDEKMSREEWDAEMARLRDRRESLQNEVNTLQNDLNNLRTTEMQNLDECLDELYALVGATKADVDNFRRAVAELDGRIRRKEGPKADRQADLNALKTNRISALPEFFDRIHNQMQQALDGWVEESTEIVYTVRRGDHLWGIARKPEHYGNPFAWPNIYQANRDQIRNPDLIYPDQKFRIPALSEEEKAKYDKLRRNYKPAPVQ